MTLDTEGPGAHTEQSRPDSGLGFHVKIPKTFQDALLPLRSGALTAAFIPEKRDGARALGICRFGVKCLGCRVHGSGFRVQGSGFRVEGAWFWISGFKPGHM